VYLVSSVSSYEQKRNIYTVRLDLLNVFDTLKKAFYKKIFELYPRQFAKFNLKMLSLQTKYTALPVIIFSYLNKKVLIHDVSKNLNFGTLPNFNILSFTTRF
jgi:hypothetical protein